MNEPLTKRLALDALHRELGARMGPFAGFEMPIQYPAGLKAEHLHTRAAAGLFDVSHMGQLRVTGPQLMTSLERALPLDFAQWLPGQQRYSLLLNEQGGIEDDLMLVLETLHPEPVVRIVVNAGNRDQDLALLQARCPELLFTWIDAALIALQGPGAGAVIEALDPVAAGMSFMQAGPLRLFGADCYASRSGYTGEDGFEISIPNAHADAVVRGLLARPGVQPIGLGARDTLRLEAGLPLHGNDIGPNISPAMAGLLFAIPKSRRMGGAKQGGFVGAQVVLEQFASPPAIKLVALISDQPAPIRAHSEIVDAAGQRVGEVVSGTLSPTLGQPIMLALIDRSLAGMEAQPDATLNLALGAKVRDRLLPVRMASLPFVPKRYKRV
jgi:aminomethyltransferase